MAKPDAHSKKHKQKQPSTPTQFALSIELSIPCRACRAPVALNAASTSVPCVSCQRPAELAASAWQMLLRDAVAQGARMATNEERATVVTTESGPVQRVVRRTEMACGNCNTVLPGPESAALVEQQGSAFCPSCGQRTPGRSASAMGVSGLLATLNEDPTLLAPAGAKTARAATEGEQIQCVKCGAGLRVDGSSRNVSCGYCRADQLVPEDVWLRLNPRARVRRWYLWCSAASGGAKTNTVRWETVHAVATDGRGNVFTLATAGADGDEITLWCTDANQEVRWKKVLPASFDEPRMTFARSGHLCLWKPDARPLEIVKTVDGSSELTLGARGAEPTARDAKFSMKGVHSLACDVDGSLLAVVRGRLARFDAGGAPVDLWPGVPTTRLRADESADEPEELGPKPTALGEDGHACVGWDGLTYLWTSTHVACFDRAGARRWAHAPSIQHAVVPAASMGMGSDLFADARGFAYLWDGGGTLVRVSPDGRSSERVLKPRASAGPGLAVGDETRLCVGPDGTIWAYGDSGALRVFSADGRVLFVSPVSQKSDREALERGDEPEEDEDESWADDE